MCLVREIESDVLLSHITVLVEGYFLKKYLWNIYVTCNNIIHNGAIW